MVGSQKGRIAALSILILAASVTTVEIGAQAPTLKITVLSSRPDMVSGGDALISVEIPSGIDGATARVTVDGRDATPAFRPGTAPRTIVGLVEGLRVGRNNLRVTAASAVGDAVLTNYPITGPVLAGPHTTPFVCMTQESGLGAPLDQNCSAPTRIDYFYKSRGFGADFKPLADSKSLPNDVAETTTRDGKKVPYIVRVESGTINRSIYRIAVLDDPRPSAVGGGWSPGPGWNRRVIMTFGAGCNTSYNQGRNTPQNALNDLFLSRGFATMLSTLNVLGLQCNDELSGETFMMLKEHFIERYGVPTWTAGSGGSGGAIQQFLIAQNFPGLLDGLMPTRTFPDLISMWSAASDCRLLNAYFDSHSAQWTAAQRDAVEGWSTGTCRSIDPQIDTIVATKSCNIPQELVYDPKTNPRGARCTIWDTNVNTYGRDPVTGFARRTYDNIGLQYGLQALNKGLITPAQFLDLNNSIGGFDNDGNRQPARTAGDLEAVRLAYAAGRVNTFGGSLGSIPIISFRVYLDDAADIHDRVRDMVIRARLQRAHGRSDNFVSWLAPAGPLLPVEEQLTLATMSDWLDALAKDTSADPAIVKVVRAKPARAVDACWDKDATRIDEPFTFDSPTSKCNKVFPVHSNARMVAGEPRTVDVLKCQLKAPKRSEYSATFSDAEWRQLTQSFAGGVCDYSRPGVNAGKITGTYQVLPLSPQPVGQSATAR